MFSKTTKRKIKQRLYAGYSNVFRGMDVNNTNFSTEGHTTNSAVWPVPFMSIAISPGHSRSDPLSFPDHVPCSILGDPGAVSRAGRKGATKVFKHRWKSPWVPTLTGPLFQMVKRMLAPDWAQKLPCIMVPNRRTASPGFFQFREFVHDGYLLDYGLSGNARSQET